MTQGGRKPAAAESHASKQVGEGKLFSQQGGRTGKVQHIQHSSGV